MNADVSYYRILAQAVGKCEHAVTLAMGPNCSNSPREGFADFQAFIPREFVVSPLGFSVVKSTAATQYDCEMQTCRWRDRFFTL
jgi:hypothetical protein